MFSIKEWNFEEYKAAVNEIQDPVERMDEKLIEYILM